MPRFDTAIIGTGPAGLSAAINLKIRQKSFVLFGSRDFSQKLILAPRIENYLGMPGITGAQLARDFAAHLAAMEIEITERQVAMIYPMGTYFSLAAGSETVEASTVILAPGVFGEKLLPGEQDFLGRGVSYCATCDAPLYRGKTVAVLGYSGEAAIEADFLATIAARVYYIPVKNAPTKPGVSVQIVQEQPLQITGDSKTKLLVLQHQSLTVDAIFIIRDATPPASLMPGLMLQNNFIAVDKHLQTNFPGCFAAGDCTGKPHQYMRAAGQGQTAALNAAAYLDAKRKDG